MIGLKPAADSGKPDVPRLRPGGLRGPSVWKLETNLETLDRFVRSGKQEELPAGREHKFSPLKPQAPSCVTDVAVALTHPGADPVVHGHLGRQWPEQAKAWTNDGAPFGGNRVGAGNHPPTMGSEKVELGEANGSGGRVRY